MFVYKLRCYHRPKTKTIDPGSKTKNKEYPNNDDQKVYLINVMKYTPGVLRRGRRVQPFTQFKYRIRLARIALDLISILSLIYVIHSQLKN